MATPRSCPPNSQTWSRIWSGIWPLNPTETSKPLASSYGRDAGFLRRGVPRRDHASQCTVTSTRWMICPRTTDAHGPDESLIMCRFRSKRGSSRASRQRCGLGRADPGAGDLRGADAQGRWAARRLRRPRSYLTGGILRIDGDRIVGVGGEPEGDLIDLGELYLGRPVHGHRGRELSMGLGGGEKPTVPGGKDDPPTRMLRAVGNARRTSRAGFTTVRNWDCSSRRWLSARRCARAKAIDAGAGCRRPRAAELCPPGQRDHSSTGGHLDPTMFAAFAPHVLDLTVEQGIANGIDEIRKAVRYGSSMAPS